MYCPKCGGSVAAGLAFCPTCGAMQAASTPQQPAMPPAAPYGAPPAYAGAQTVWDYATWATRAVGYIIDFLLIGAGMVVLYLVGATVLTSMAGLLGHDAAGSTCCMMIILFPVASLVVGLYNNWYLVAQRGYTIGQGVVKVKVVDANGQLLTQSAALIRLLVRVALACVPLLPLLDLLWPLWDDRRQTLHDKAVNCYVINWK